VANDGGNRPGSLADLVHRFPGTGRSWLWVSQIGGIGLYCVGALCAGERSVASLVTAWCTGSVDCDGAHQWMVSLAATVSTMGIPEGQCNEALLD